MSCEGDDAVKTVLCDTSPRLEGRVGEARAHNVEAVLEALTRRSKMSESDVARSHTADSKCVPPSDVRQVLVECGQSSLREGHLGEHVGNNSQKVNLERRVAAEGFELRGDKRSCVCKCCGAHCCQSLK